MRLPIPARTAFGLACLLCTTASIASAQISTLPAGTRVRFTTGASDAQFVGELAAQTRDSVRIEKVRGGGGAQANLVAAITDLRTFERSTATRRFGFEGAVVGAGLGGVVMWMVQSADDEVQCPTPNDLICSDVVVSETLGRAGGMIAAVAGGALIGAIVGHSIAHDKWEPLARTASGRRALGVTLKWRVD